MFLTSLSRALYFIFEQLMEKLNFDYSLKNIQIPDNKTEKSVSYIKNIFKRKLYLPEDHIKMKLKVVNFSSC